VLIAGMGAASSAVSDSPRADLSKTSASGGSRAVATGEVGADRAILPGSGVTHLGERARPTTISRSGGDRAPSLEDTLAERLEGRRTAALDRISVQAARRTGFLRDNPWMLPLTSYRITALFGQASALWSNNHTGVDFAAPTGTPVRTVAPGTVTKAGYDGSYGYKVEIVHDDGTETWYAHMNSIAVAVGQEVTVNEVVGTVGSTGNVTGPHLHLEVRPLGGDPVDPLLALRERGLAP
jgi:murein DD-endopeptidase MepM/ murein hydrolase activator NlpD